MRGSIPGPGPGARMTWGTRGRNPAGGAFSRRPARLSGRTAVPALGETIMTIRALGYVGIEARSPEDWAGYGTRFLGLQLAERSAHQLVFRMDDRRQRLVVTPGERNGAQIGRAHV